MQRQKHGLINSYNTERLIILWVHIDVILFEFWQFLKRFLKNKKTIKTEDIEGILKVLRDPRLNSQKNDTNE